MNQRRWQRWYDPHRQLSRANPAPSSHTERPVSLACIAAFTANFILVRAVCSFSQDPNSLWNSLSDIRLNSRRAINYRFRLGLQPSRTKWGILMTLLFRSGGSPAEAFTSHIPAGFSFQLKAVLLIPVGATHPRTKKSKRWLLVGSKAGKYTVLWGETIRLTSSRGSNSVPDLARFFLTFPLHTKQSFAQSHRWSLLSLCLLNNDCKVQEHQSRRNTCF